MDIYNFKKETKQEIYDSYNNLVFSNDTRVIHKMIIKINIFSEIKDLNGDILEFGVFKGGSLALWLQLMKLYQPHSLTKIIGFDFFNHSDTLKNLNEQNKDLMNNVLSRSNETDTDINNIKIKCDNIIEDSTILIKGDAIETSKKFNDNNPGARIKLLYLDLDLGEPTFHVLKNLWDKVVIDGIILLDEYGFHKWDESNGVDDFLKTVEGKYILKNTFISAPTLIIKKIKY